MNENADQSGNDRFMAKGEFSMKLHISKTKFSVICGKLRNNDSLKQNTFLVTYCLQAVVDYNFCGKVETCFTLNSV